MKGSFQPVKLHSFLRHLLLVVLLSIPLISASRLFIRTRLVYATPTLGEWHSIPSEKYPGGIIIPDEDKYDNSTIVTDPTNAFDQNEYSYANFTIQDGHWFEVKLWDYSGGEIKDVNYTKFTMIWEVIGTSDDEYRILYYVDPSIFPGILQPWQTGDQAKTSTWTATIEPNDGKWSETDINNIRFRVETQHHGGIDGATFRVWEARLTVYYVPPTVSIQPSSTEYIITPPKVSTILRPNGDGTYTAWDGDYTDWDEDLQNGDADYASTTLALKTETSVFEDHTTEDWDIGRVKLVVWARMTAIDDDPEEVNLRLRIGTMIYKGDQYALTTEYKKYTSEWAVNPATDSNWTWTDIDNLHAGVRSYASGTWTGEMRVTQIYIEVSGEAYQVDVHVENVVNMFGWQFELTFDASVLHGVNWAGTKPVYLAPFLESAGGTARLAPKPGFNNTEGKLALQFAYLMETDPLELVDGSGVISTVAFTAVGVGPSDITLGPDTLIAEGLRGEYITVQLAHGSFEARMLGDVDGDGDVDVSDLFDLSKAYDSAPGDPNWDERCDLNGDNKVDASDLFDLSKYYGKTV